MGSVIERLKLSMQRWYSYEKVEIPNLPHLHRAPLCSSMLARSAQYPYSTRQVHRRRRLGHNQVYQILKQAREKTLVPTANCQTIIISTIDDGVTTYRVCS